MNWAIHLGYLREIQTDYQKDLKKEFLHSENWMENLMVNLMAIRSGCCLVSPLTDYLMDCLMDFQRVNHSDYLKVKH